MCRLTGCCADGQWDLTHYHLIELGKQNQSIRAMCVVANSVVWCACQNKIHVIHPETLQLQVSNTIQSKYKVKMVMWLTSSFALGEISVLGFPLGEIFVLGFPLGEISVSGFALGEISGRWVKFPGGKNKRHCKIVGSARTMDLFF